MRRRCMSARFGGLLLAWCLCVTGTAAHAQETINTGSISGRVIDPQGALVPGAAVVARQTDTNVTAETTSDPQGRFRFAYLRVGRYEIKAHLQGFADAARALTVT